MSDEVDGFDADDDDDGVDIYEVVTAILSAAQLPDEASDAVFDCLEGAASQAVAGWLVVWWMGVAVDVAVTERFGYTMPSGLGWNAILIADRESLLEIVIDAADQASACVVVDIEECF
jgi:hypothetical protein